MNRKTKMWTSAALCLLLIVLAGCQAVAGSNVDLNKVGENVVNEASYQANASVKVEWLGDAAGGPGDLGPFTLDLNAIDQQDRKHGYVEGELTYAKGSVPFRLSVADQQLLLEAEGGAQVEFDQSALLANVVKLQLPVDTQTIAKSSDELLRIALPYLISKLPNAKGISIEPASETIHEENVDLSKIHLELDGPEMAVLFKQLLGNLQNDENGLKDTISKLIGVVTNPSPIFVNIVYGTVVEQLKKLSDSAAPSLLGDRTSLQADLYVDSDLQLRKSDIDLTLGAGSADSGQSVRITASSEKWNVNKPVVAKQLTPAANRIKWTPETRMAHYLKTIEPQSSLHELLFDDLHITRKTIKMQLSATNEITNSAPYIRNDVTMVPARFVSEQLSAEVAWDPDKRQVHITDILTGKMIVLTIDSKTALVDGQPVELESAAEITDGTTFVPVGFIATTFGADKHWDNDTRTVTITKP